MNINSIAQKVLAIYLFTFSIRSLIHLIVQLAYLTLSRQLQSKKQSSKDNENSDKDLEILVNRIANFMATYGQIHRDVGTTGVFYYCLLFFSCFIFYSIRFVSRGKYLNYFEEIGFIAFIKNQDVESVNIGNKIQACLHNLVRSNLNFGRKSFAGSSNTVSQFNRYCSVKLSNSKRSIHRTDSSDKHLHHSCYLIKSLRGQLNHLMKLSLNKGKIWPPNRNRVWARELTRFSLSLYILVGTFNWLVAEVGCFIIIDYLYKTANQNNREGNKFTIFDRLCSVDYIIYAYFGADFFTTPLVVSITSIEDQIKFLDTFGPKLGKICDKAKMLERINSTIQLYPYSIRYLNRAKSKLRTECDQEAIEMYISYQLFLKEIEPSIKLARNSVGQLVSLALCCLLPTSLMYHRDIPKDQLLIFMCVCLTFLLSVNGTFLMCASLHVSCSRVSKLVWSFVAIAEAYNHQQYSITTTDTNNQAKTTSTKRNSRHGLKTGLFHDDDVAEGANESSYLTYYYHSLVTPHTMFLWRRLAETEELIAENFVCKLYGLFGITYKGILSINYLLITYILYTMTYHR